MPFVKLLAVTVVTWLVHVAINTGYTKLFSDTRSLVFRLVYALELTATFSLSLWLYLQRQPVKPSLAMVLLTVVGYLAIIDTTLYLTVGSVRKTFDVWHFAVAYALLALSLTILYKLLAKSP